MARAMKDSGVEWIGEIPREWKTPKIINQFDLIGSGTTPKSYADSYYVDGEINWIQSGDLHDQYLASTEKRVTKIAFEQTSALKMYFPKYLVIAMYGASVGNLSIATIEACTNQACCVLAKEKGILKYMYYVLVAAKEYLIYSAVGGTQPNISQNVIKNLRIPIPDLINKQQIIADFLDKKVGEIDSVIVKTKETIEDYKKYKQAIITDAVTKGLNPDVEMKESKSNYLGFIPVHWREKRLRFLGTCQNGISKSAEYFGEGYPFISYGDVYKNYTLPKDGSGLVKSSEEDRKVYSVQYGDVFFTRTSETIEEVGFTSTCLKTIEDAVFAGFVIRFRPYNQEELLPEFSKYYFRSNAHRKFFVKEMNLVTRASLSQELLKKLPILLPPIEEQKEIAAYLDEKCSEIDKLIAKKEELLADLESYKKSLIYEYVTGKRQLS